MSLDQLNLEGYTPKEKALRMLDEFFRAYGDSILFSEYRIFYDAIESIHEVSSGALEDALGMVNNAYENGEIATYSLYSPLYDMIMSIDPLVENKEGG